LACAASFVRVNFSRFKFLLPRLMWPRLGCFAVFSLGFAADFLFVFRCNTRPCYLVFLPALVFTASAVLLSFADFHATLQIFDFYRPVSRFLVPKVFLLFHSQVPAAKIRFLFFVCFPAKVFGS
jgi:hypothetical protein